MLGSPDRLEAGPSAVEQRDFPWACAPWRDACHDRAKLCVYVIGPDQPILLRQKELSAILLDPFAKVDHVRRAGDGERVHFPTFGVVLAHGRDVGAIVEVLPVEHGGLASGCGDDDVGALHGVLACLGGRGGDVVFVFDLLGEGGAVFGVGGVDAYGVEVSDGLDAAELSVGLASASYQGERVGVLAGELVDGDGACGASLEGVELAAVDERGEFSRLGAEEGGEEPGVLRLEPCAVGVSSHGACLGEDGGVPGEEPGGVVVFEACAGSGGCAVAAFVVGFPDGVDEGVGVEVGLDVVGGEDADGRHRFEGAWWGVRVSFRGARVRGGEP